MEIRVLKEGSTKKRRKGGRSERQREKWCVGKKRKEGNWKKKSKKKKKERYKKVEVVGKVQRFDSRFLCTKKQRTTERRR